MVQRSAWHRLNVCSTNKKERKKLTVITLWMYSMSLSVILDRLFAKLPLPLDVEEERRRFVLNISSFHQAKLKKS